MGDHVADHRGAHDGDAAHGGRARLLDVRVRERTVVVDLLTDALAAQDDDVAGAEDAQEKATALLEQETHQRHHLPVRRLQRAATDPAPPPGSALHQHDVAVVHEGHDERGRGPGVGDLMDLHAPVARGDCRGCGVRPDGDEDVDPAR